MRDRSTTVYFMDVYVRAAATNHASASAKATRLFGLWASANLVTHTRRSYQLSAWRRINGKSCATLHRICLSKLRPRTISQRVSAWAWSSPRRATSGATGSTTGGKITCRILRFYLRTKITDRLSRPYQFRFLFNMRNGVSPCTP